MTEPAQQPGRPLGRLIWQDIKRCAAVAVFGCIAFAIVEYALSLHAYALPLRLATALRFALLVVTLTLLLWAGVTVLLAVTAFATRTLIALRSPELATTWTGLLPPWRRFTHARVGVAWLWAVTVGAAVFVLLSAWLSHYSFTNFREARLSAFLAASLQIIALAVCALLVYLIQLPFAALGRKLARSLRTLNPFGQTGPALLLMTLVLGPALLTFFLLVPQARPLVPWRHIIALGTFGAGVFVGTVVMSLRGGLFPRTERRRLIAVVMTVFLASVVAPLTLLRVGADPETKYMAVTASPPLATIIDYVRAANDFDGDGYGSLLGENDCAPFNSKIHPLARDIADNGIDENCDGRDFSATSLPSYRLGERMPVPKEFQRSGRNRWNFLLLTVDTLRYDHTGFGGYERNTTPHLDKLVARSTSFTFANAPSAGTMASMPAILTSKFFHSGIGLEYKGVRRGLPPRLKKENVLVSEILKRAKYTNGAVLTHEYFNDWGMQQGFDTYDNDLGAKHDPYIIAADRTTDRGLAWIARHHRKHWFLWMHYIDPHGRYVAHPGEKSWGTTEMDLYDGELAFTDKHIGRLINELGRVPGGDRTIIIITSDHGDGFNEHGFINHGRALYRELLHVPLIVYVPNLPAKTVDGAVSPLDIVPTIADLAGINVKDLSFEGESLIPQLFYDRDAHHRVVFAETNWPKPLRACITSKHKLIYNLQHNLYEFFDLTTDAWEQKNLALSRPRPKAMATLKGYLDDWLERVYYARDPKMSQAAEERMKFLLTAPPSPQNKTDGVAFDDGRIVVLGFDTDKPSYQPGDQATVTVYFHASEQPSGSFSLQVDAIASQATPARSGRSRLRFTGKDGTFATARWRKGDFVRDIFKVRLPKWTAAGPRLDIGLRMRGKSKLLPIGAVSDSDKHLAILGQVSLATAPVDTGVGQ